MFFRFRTARVGPDQGVGAQRARPLRATAFAPSSSSAASYAASASVQLPCARRISPSQSVRVRVLRVGGDALARVHRGLVVIARLELRLGQRALAARHLLVAALRRPSAARAPRAAPRRRSRPARGGARADHGAVVDRAEGLEGGQLARGPTMTTTGCSAMPRLPYSASPASTSTGRGEAASRAARPRSAAGTESETTPDPAHGLAGERGLALRQFAQRGRASGPGSAGRTPAR